MKYTVGGVGLNLLELGSGEKTLFFLHYFGGSSRTWRPVMEMLAADYRCLALDLRGWGDSDTVPEAACRVEDMTEDTRQVIAALGLTRYTLVGHSMGGKAALALASDPPPGLEQLLLVAPSPLSPEPMTEDDRASMKAAYGSEAASRKTLETIACLPLSPQITELVIADNFRASRAAWEAWADLGSKQDLSALAPKILVPTHVLSGTGDAVLSPEVLQKEVVASISGATLTTIPDAGHLLPLEAPEAVANWLRARLV